MEKLKMRQILSLTFASFAIFFGAGNMIFPPGAGSICLPGLYDHFHWTHHVLCRLFS